MSKNIGLRSSLRVWIACSTTAFLSGCSLLVDASGLADGPESSDQHVAGSEAGASNDDANNRASNDGNAPGDDGSQTDADSDASLPTGAPGTGDPTFGDAGVVTVSVGDSTSIGSFAIQGDGKIVVGGGVLRNGSFDFFAKRLQPSGLDDTTFNGTGTAFYDFVGDNDWVEDVFIQPDGRIVLVGDAYNGNAFDVGIVRYNEAGTLDTSFGAGLANVYQDDLPLRILRQSDGKLVTVGRVGLKSQYQFGGARFTANGALDTTYGSNGVFHSTFGAGNCPGSDGVPLSDGTVLVAGGVTSGSDMNFGLARYTAAGVLDTTFCTNGLCTYSFGTSEDFPFGVTRQTDGKVLMGGYMTKQGHYHSAIVRAGVDGAPDTTFGNGGKVTLEVSGDDEVANVAVHDDWIYVSGYVLTGNDTTDIYVARLDTSGQLDPSFGSSGISKFHFGPGWEWPSRMLVQSDGKVIVSGSYDLDGTPTGFMLRLLP